MMSLNAETATILLADDDEDDCLLLRKALERNRLANRMDTVVDGEQLMDYLHGRGDYVGQALPGVILLDLNMPRMDGHEALREIRESNLLRHIPVVVMSTSHEEEDVYRSYDLGANSYIQKPVTFDGLVDVIRNLGSYWFKIVRLPAPAEPEAAS
jgi:CheY-like chemotaxis protein